MSEANTVSRSEKGLRKIFSIVVITAMVFGGLAVAFASMNAVAVKDLVVTGTDLAPPEGVFPGDNNISMLWLELMPQDEAISITSMTFALTGTSTIADADVTKIWLHDDVDGDAIVSQNELAQANFGVLSSRSQPFTFPVTLTLSGYFAGPFNPDYIIVLIDVNTGTEGDLVGLSLTAVANDADTSQILTPDSSDATVKTVIWSDEMESGVGGWVAAGGPVVFWHQTSKTPYLAYSPTTAWWYADEVSENYFVGPPPGVRNYGNLTSPAVDLSGYSAPAMSFWHDLITENQPGSDEARVLIEDQAVPGTWTEILFLRQSQNWSKPSFDLSAYAGKTVKLKFFFDTIDYMNNLQKGWSLDRMYFFGAQETNDVATTSFSVKNFGIPAENIYVNATIANLGQAAEDNGTNGVDAWLKIDGAYVQVDNIPAIPLAGSQFVSFIWTPGVTGDYDICIHAWPVSGETNIGNNEVCKIVKIRDQPVRKIFVLRSYGTKMGPAITTWLDLNADWETYGVTPIEIDYQTLNKTGISYAEISATGADALVLSASGALGAAQAWSELTLAEVAAIRQYTVEGHGLIATGTSFYWSIPTNNDLTDMFGIIDQPYDFALDGAEKDLDMLVPLHPLLTNVVGDPFTIGNNHSTAPQDDMTWDASDLRPGSLGGEYIAKSAGGENALVEFKKLVYFSWIPEFYSNSTDKQILYNAMVWSDYDIIAHDVAMSNLIGPVRAKPAQLMDFTATLINLASVDEDNATNGIDVVLTEDGTIVDQANIAFLGVGASTDVTLTWDPPITPATYNMCMKAWQVAGEIDTSNNEVCMGVEVIDPDITVVAILDSWGTDYSGLAPWDELNTMWPSYGLHEILIDYTTLNKEDFTLLDLTYSGADVLMISTSNSTNDPDAQFTLAEATAIQSYVGSGHGIVGTGLSLNSMYLVEHNQLAPLFGLDSGVGYSNTTGVTSYEKIIAGHTIFYQIPTSPFTTASGISCVAGTEWDASVLLPGAEYLGSSTPTPSQGAMVGNESINYRGIYLSNAHEIASNQNDKQILYNAMIWAGGTDMYPSTDPDPPEDLWIFVQADQLVLDWIVKNPQAEVQFNIFRSLTVDGFNFLIPHSQVASPPYFDSPGTATDTDNYFYVVRAINITSLRTETNTNKVGKFYNKLHKGTNDISIPFDLQDTSVDVVFSAIAMDIDRVMAYDTATGTWLMWIPGIGGTLTDVDNTMGIRVESKNNNVEFVSVGRVNQSKPIDLTIGMSNWFFVGYPCFNMYPLPDILDMNGLAGLYALVLYYDPTDRRAPWKWFDPNDPGGSPLQVLETGKGYWIYMNMNGIWTVPGE